MRRAWTVGHGLEGPAAGSTTTPELPEEARACARVGAKAVPSDMRLEIVVEMTGSPRLQISCQAHHEPGE